LDGLASALGPPFSESLLLGRFATVFELVAFEFAGGMAELRYLVFWIRFGCHVMSTSDGKTEREAPPYYYIAFIDEAGDSGLERVRPIDEPGGSEWLVIGGVLIEVEHESSPYGWVRSALDAARSRRPELHYRLLQEWQKPLVCQKFVESPVKLFAVCSNKKNMRQYKNERAEARSNPLFTKQTFYNFCIRLILERITDFVLHDSMLKYGEPRYVKCYFSKRGGHNYGHLSNYLFDTLFNQARSRTTLLKRREIKWQVIHRRLQEPVVHTGNAGVQLADIVASAFFQAVDILPPTNWDIRNAKMLRDRMAMEAGFYHDYGVTFQPCPQMTRAQLAPQQKEIFEFFGFDRRDFDVPWPGEAARPGLSARLRSA
jgi:hypothetical protein